MLIFIWDRVPPSFFSCLEHLLPFQSGIWLLIWYLAFFILYLASGLWLQSGIWHPLYSIYIWHPIWYLAASSFHDILPCHPSVSSFRGILLLHPSVASFRYILPRHPSVTFFILLHLHILSYSPP